MAVAETTLLRTLAGLRSPESRRVERGDLALPWACARCAGCLDAGRASGLRHSGRAARLHRRPSSRRCSVGAAKRGRVARRAASTRGSGGVPPWRCWLCRSRWARCGCWTNPLMRSTTGREACSARRCRRMPIRAVRCSSPATARRWPSGCGGVRIWCSDELGPAAPRAAAGPAPAHGCLAAAGLLCGGGQPLSAGRGPRARAAARDGAGRDLGVRAAGQSVVAARPLRA